MSDVNEALTRKVAFLARLSVTEDEVQKFTPQLKDVLGYIDQLSKVDTDGVMPLFTPCEWNTPQRDDVVHPGTKDADGKPKVLQAAPDTLYEGFKVPPIL